MHHATLPPPDIWPLHPEEARLPHHDMVWVEGGTFTMGSSDDEAFDAEKHLRDVTLPSFCMARFPVTQALYLVVMGIKNPSRFIGEDRPVERVSWDDAQLFIQKLNEKTGRTRGKWRYALPSEAQWEYAARGGQTGAEQPFKYAGSDKLKEVGWFIKNSHGETKPVGLKRPNALGLYDMSGNVWEWCEDDWHDSYENAPNDGTAWVDDPKQGLLRVRRGGSWSNASRYCNMTYTTNHISTLRYLDIGFRLCLAPV